MQTREGQGGMEGEGTSGQGGREGGQGRGKGHMRDRVTDRGREEEAGSWKDGRKVEEGMFLAVGSWWMWKARFDAFFRLLHGHFTHITLGAACASCSTMSSCGCS